MKLLLIFAVAVVALVLGEKDVDMAASRAELRFNNWAVAKPLKRDSKLSVNANHLSSDY